MRCQNKVVILKKKYLILKWTKRSKIISSEVHFFCFWLTFYERLVNDLPGSLPGFFFLSFFLSFSLSFFLSLFQLEFFLSFFHFPRLEICALLDIYIGDEKKMSFFTFFLCKLFGFFRKGSRLPHLFEEDLIKIFKKYY